MSTTDSPQDARSSAPELVPVPPAGASTPKPGHERRNQRRYPVRWRAALELDHGSLMYQGRTLNLSSQGCMFISDHNIRGHGLTRLHLQMPSTRPGAAATVVSFEVRITHTSLSGQHKGFIVCLSFTANNLTSIEKLQDYFGEKPALRH